MAMTVNPVRQMKKLEKDLRQWCADPTTDWRAKIDKSLRKELASTHPRAAVVATVDLDYLATWHAQHGALAILEGRIEGWANIDLALHYQWWTVRIHKDTTLVNKLALILAHAIVFEEDSLAEWVAELLIRSLEGTTPKLWKYATFGTFLLKLWAMHRGLPDIDVARPDMAALGVYQRVLDTWSNPVELRSALGAACDYHLEQSWTARGFPPFVYGPYQMFPVDILAIARVRRDLGLEMPKVDHPLLATPLATPPPGEQRPRMPQPDPLLEKLIQKAKDTGFL
jgi:hypothetical protein